MDVNSVQLYNIKQCSNYNKLNLKLINVIKLLNLN